MELPVLVLVAVILPFGTSTKLNVPRLRLSYKGRLMCLIYIAILFIFTNRTQSQRSNENELPDYEERTR